jgi:dethiobiotin synthetase
MNVFVTGTDTGIGKTLVSAALLTALARRGARALGMKPVASGCHDTAAGLRNADAERLRAASTSAVDYTLVNPYALRDPIAPHIAAQDAGLTITLEPIRSAFTILRQQSDVIVVEGVGGWCAPLGQTLMQADLVGALDLAVLLVVGLRLGCLNHAILTARAIAHDGCRLLGWVGNQIDPDMTRVEENLATLRARLPAPCLGVLPHAAPAAVETLADRLEAAATLMVADAYRTAP